MSTLYLSARMLHDRSIRAVFYLRRSLSRCVATRLFQGSSPILSVKSGLAHVVAFFLCYVSEALVRLL